nr:hypothetical protein [Actinopolyspora mortivallis]
MATFGFGSRAWTHHKPIAEGHLIRDYLRRTMTDNGLDEYLRLGRRVTDAEFSSSRQRWTVTARRSDDGEETEFTARFLFLGTGYYDYDEGFMPDFSGVEDFEGRVVHPQHWPRELD